MTKKELKIQQIMLLREKLRRSKTRNMYKFTPYDWQKKLFDAGLGNRQRLLMAANRVGKTYCAAMELAYHATGWYPDDWGGCRFTSPPKIWALGSTSEQIRDVIQNALFGDLIDGENFGTGSIPLDNIITESMIRSSQTKGLIKDIKIHHVNGYSTISFKAYSQGQHVMMGSSIDLIWVDEEPRDQDIYPQLLIRTTTGNGGKGGHVLLTFTPENGLTPLISQFTDDLADGQFLLNVTWDDAPHLDDDTKAQILSAIPEYQREMRSKGVPVLGSGIIFPISDEEITCAPFKCPDHFHVLNGLDFGWSHPQACVQLWHDRDEDILYLAHAWKRSELDAVQAWTAVKGWSSNVPVAWPHDGLQHEKSGGLQLKGEYSKAGFRMLGEHATWPEGGMSVESGLWQMLQYMRDCRFKVFSTLTDWFEEKRMYHRDDGGKVIKIKDDLISATRYAFMMRRFAIPMNMVKRVDKVKMHIEHDFDPYKEVLH